MATIDYKKADTFEISGNWTVQAKYLKVKYKDLSDSDLKFEIGKEQDLLLGIERILKKDHDEVINIIRDGRVDFFCLP